MSVRPPAHVAPIVEALGVDGAVTFLMTFGGSELYVPASPKGRSRLAEEMGLEAAEAISAIADRLPRRIPTAKPWIAAVWKSRGLPVAEIARRLHVADKTVRGWLRSAGPSGPDPRQPSLF